jgi:hypothetical protein
MVVVGITRGVNTHGRPKLYHVENPEMPGFSYCGRELRTRWELKALPPDAADHEVICHLCRKVSDERAKADH